MGLNNSKNIALYQAVKTNNYNECKRLIENGADVNYYTDFYGSFPLMAATLNGNADICKLLLENHADVNQKYSFGRTNTCIELAKDHNLVKILLDAGATIHNSLFARNNEIKDVIINERKKQKTFNRRSRILFYL
jgi:ankyrin repeat protein